MMTETNGIEARQIDCAMTEECIKTPIDSMGNDGHILKITPQECTQRNVLILTLDFQAFRRFEHWESAERCRTAGKTHPWLPDRYCDITAGGLFFSFTALPVDFDDDGNPVRYATSDYAIGFRSGSEWRSYLARGRL